MYNVLSIGKSGIKANQFKMDGLADELANVTTDGYKKRTITFQELLVDQDTNMGTKTASAKIDFSQGILTPSPSTFHMAIEGNGFFGIRDENDNLMLTRNGSFFADAENNIRNASGDLVEVEYAKALSEWESRDVSISEDGSIQERETGEILGRVMVYMPENLASLKPVSGSMFAISQAGNLIEYNDNPEIFGMVRQNYIEASNADMSKSMIDMIVTQRAYSLNSSTVQSTDELMRLINEIKR